MVLQQKKKLISCPTAIVIGKHDNERLHDCVCAMLNKAIVVLLLDSCPNQVDVRRMGVYDVNLNSENIFILERLDDKMVR